MKSDIINTMKILVWEVRHIKGITLKELAALSGISKTTINEIENEKRMPNLAQLEALAKAMNVGISDLFESEYK